MRTYLFAIAALFIPQLAQAVDGFDLPGSDYRNFNASLPLICRNSCGSDIRCRAWTWVKPGIQGPQGRCWLKNSLPALVRNPCCDSGSGEDLSRTDMKPERRADRPGSDYQNFEIASFDKCESACAGDRRCFAWTFVRPGIQGPQGRCWLKTRVPDPIDNGDTVSGVKFRGFAF